MVNQWGNRVCKTIIGTERLIKHTLSLNSTYHWICTEMLNRFKQLLYLQKWWIARLERWLTTWVRVTVIFFCVVVCKKKGSLDSPFARHYETDRKYQYTGV